MTRFVRTGAVVAGVLFLLNGCGKSPDTGKDKLYDVKGTVVSTDPQKQTVTLDHEDIPGLMKAMKMDFKAADPKLLDGLRPGDAVEGKLKAEAGGYVVTELRKR